MIFVDTFVIFLLRSEQKMGTMTKKIAAKGILTTIFPSLEEKISKIQEKNCFFHVL